MESNNSLLNDSMWEFPYSPTHPAIAAAYILILIVASVWNLLLIVVMIRNRSVCREPAAIFLFMLAIVDFVTAVGFTPFNTVTAIANGFIFGPTDVIRIGLCKTLAFLLSVFVILSLFILALISFDRFLIIVYSLNYERIMKPWRALLLFVVVCIPSVIICIPPFFGFGHYGYSVHVGSCLFQWAGQGPYVALYVTLAVIPIIAAFVFSLITYIYIRRFFNRQRRQASRWSIDVDKVTETHKTRQNSLTRIFLALSATQAICFLPPTLSAFVSVFIGVENIPDAVLTISLILVMSNTAINPIVQSIFRKEMRQVIHSILRICKCYKTKASFEKKNGSTFHATTSTKIGQVHVTMLTSKNGHSSDDTDTSCNDHVIVETSPCADTSSNKS